MPGLIKRSGTWHIDKIIFGRRVCQSTGTTELTEAERFLSWMIEQNRQTSIYGVRPQRTFEQATAKYVTENQHKRTIETDVGRLRGLLPWIGALPLDKVHMGSLQPWLADRKAKRRKTGTINNCLQVVRRILNLAATEWMDGNDLTWLETPVKIKLLPVTDRKKPYPLNWEEQGRLFRELPPHLAEMALFAVNTGCRDAEICYLRWEYEIEVPSMNTSVFIVPEDFVKNGDERLIVLNRFAQSVIEGRRGKHPEWVFTFKGHNMTRMLNSAWRRARTRAGLPGVRVHDLKHTFGRRLRAAGVSFEHRQDLLGHRSGRITTHYSAAELGSLIEAANRVCDTNDRRPELVVLRGRVPQKPRKPKG